MSAETVANTIREQLGIFGLGVVGASHLAYSAREGLGALTFKARLHFSGHHVPRVMRVTIVLTPADLYDIKVTRPDCTEYLFAEDVFADQLTNLMYQLDKEGVPA